MRILTLPNCIIVLFVQVQLNKSIQIEIDQVKEIRNNTES